ncbi:ribosome maturation factor RimM [Noviherbaspirillum sp. CPCC 100848]|uniref:Ribosome maturation factor RimM n=1 Tax=Noviherbaspirillum album TaxID=3080276 RepID=A0ABU6J4L8_9BURK|nr:ribosome maturation factor RimM [Noviherbaspirillum sp. CPCC 100848]MEC4718564.1 ribosome maturation factor RimM [Noviherbaspirillum sp. CPCC 100848]
MVVPDDLVLVGHITGAYGIHGWVRIKPYSLDADALLHAKTWWLDKPALRDVDMLQAKIHGEDVVAMLMGVADRNAAEALKGATVQVRRSHFPPLEDDEFYWIDLIGLAVENLEGEVLGTVAGLMDNGAHPILQVAGPAPVAENQKPKEWLIPFVDQFVKSVDQAGRKVVVDWGVDF